MTAVLHWRCCDRVFDLSNGPLVMGILNVTPDSFSDGGRYLDPRSAIARGLELVAEGADIVDVGGESTRPGALPVDAAEEQRRVIPVVEQLAAAAQCVISVDTTKAVVARAALAAGAHIINDTSGLEDDPDMPAVAREFGAGVVVMHRRGPPATMQADPRYTDVVGEVADYLAGRLRALAAAGLNPECAVIDPGIGFGKTLAHNVRLLAQLDRLTRLGRPVLVGVSRKSLLGGITGRAVGERLPASLAAAAYALTRGAHIIRVHDVKDSCDVARVVAIFQQEESRDGDAAESNPVVGRRRDH